MDYQQSSSQTDEIQAYKNFKYSVQGVLEKGPFFGLAARNNITGESVAIQVQSRQAVVPRDIRRKQKQGILLQEILRHRQETGHPYVLGFKEIFLTPNFICIVTEMPQGKMLFEHVQNCKNDQQPISEDTARRYFQQLILCQRFCHDDHTFNHNILQKNTIFVQNTTRGDEIITRLKVCNFRLVEVALNTAQWNSHCGPFQFMSPELVFLQSNYQTYDGQKVEVWACGIVLYYLLTGEYLYGEYLYRRITYILEAIKKSRIKFPNNSSVSVGAKLLVTRMLDRNPKTRYSLQQIVDDPWFRVDLPSFCNQKFEKSMQEKLKDQQSEDEIKQIIQELFQTSEDEYFVEQNTD
eukprot:TRINITY_DN576_c0_g1_i3.p1 TRINITY_DN576_c0_g1~~TRINITY_DN576_c0_g1_i3.p1  ORF type:complete len:351 (-),score=11.87 TRINITY_DN576_c0_g1_i3:450-1502(-)